MTINEIRERLWPIVTDSAGATDSRLSLAERDACAQHVASLASALYWEIGA